MILEMLTMLIILIGTTAAIFGVYLLGKCAGRADLEVENFEKAHRSPGNSQS